MIHESDEKKKDNYSLKHHLIKFGKILIVYIIYKYVS